MDVASESGAGYLYLFRRCPQAPESVLNANTDVNPPVDFSPYGFDRGIAQSDGSYAVAESASACAGSRVDGYGTTLLLPASDASPAKLAFSPVRGQYAAAIQQSLSGGVVDTARRDSWCSLVAPECLCLEPASRFGGGGEIDMFVRIASSTTIAMTAVMAYPEGRFWMWRLSWSWSCSMSEVEVRAYAGRRAQFSAEDFTTS